MQNMDEVTKIVMKYVNKVVEKYEDKSRESTDSDNFEGILVKLLKIDKDVAVVMAADMLSAGIDTTATALAGILYALATHQDKQERLREEIFNLLPDKNSQFTIKSLDNIPYTRAVIKEGMRLYPVINGNLRRTTQDLVLAGHQVPKGVRLS
jgi:cytochrome P450 family 12